MTKKCKNEEQSVSITEIKKSIQVSDIFRNFTIFKADDIKDHAGGFAEL